jgi:hypothetical protein
MRKGLTAKICREDTATIARRAGKALHPCIDREGWPRSAKLLGLSKIENCGRYTVESIVGGIFAFQRSESKNTFASATSKIGVHCLFCLEDAEASDKIGKNVADGFYSQTVGIFLDDGQHVHADCRRNTRDIFPNDAKINRQIQMRVYATSTIRPFGSLKNARRGDLRVADEIRHGVLGS